MLLVAKKYYTIVNFEGSILTSNIYTAVACLLFQFITESIGVTSERFIYLNYATFVTLETFPLD